MRTGGRGGDGPLPASGALGASALSSTASRGAEGFPGNGEQPRSGAQTKADPEEPGLTSRSCLVRAMRLLKQTTRSIAGRPGECGDLRGPQMVMPRRHKRGGREQPLAAPPPSSPPGAPGPPACWRARRPPGPPRPSASAAARLGFIPPAARPRFPAELGEERLWRGRRPAGTSGRRRSQRTLDFRAREAPTEKALQIQLRAEAPLRARPGGERGALRALEGQRVAQGESARATRSL